MRVWQLADGHPSSIQVGLWRLTEHRSGVLAQTGVQNHICIMAACPLLGSVLIHSKIKVNLVTPFWDTGIPGVSVRAALCM